MTTDAQIPQDEERIPFYFANFLNEFGRFREENERQHGALRAELSALEVRIAQMEARLMWRGLGGLALIASLTVAAMRLLPA